MLLVIIERKVAIIEEFLNHYYVGIVTVRDGLPLLVQRELFVPSQFIGSF